MCEGSWESLKSLEGLPILVGKAENKAHGKAGHKTQMLRRKGHGSIRKLATAAKIDKSSLEWVLKEDVTALHYQELTSF